MTAKQLSREIAAMAFGKAVYALTPIISAIGPERRDLVFRSLAAEYAGFDGSVERLLRPAIHGLPDRSRTDG